MRLFLGIIIFWMSIFGYLLYFKKKTKLPYELLLPIIFSLIGILMFLSGILNIMVIATILICLTGIVLFIQKIIKKEFELKKLLNINFLIFLIVFIYISIVCSRMQILHYDNFSHWGLIVKSMFLENKLPNFENPLITFKTYQPGSACFIYYFGFISGKSEASMIIAQNYMLIGYLFSLFAFTNKKTKSKKNYILKALLIAFYIFILFGNVPFNELLVDTLIATISISTFAIMYHFKNNLKKAFIYNLPTLIFLFLVKNTGIVLVGFSCLGLIYLGYKNKQLKKGFIYALLTGIVVIAFFYIWSRHVSYVFGYSGLSSKHSLTPDNIISELKNKGLDNIIEFCKIYIKHFIDIVNNIPNKYMIGINIGIISMIVFFKKHRKHFTTCLIISNVIYFMYYAILGIMYLLSMPWKEAIILASFDRYMLTIIFIIIGIVLLFFINIVIKEKLISKKSVIISSGLIISILFITFKYYVNDYKLFIGDLNYEDSIAYKFDEILGTRYYKADDDTFFYVYVSDLTNNDYGYTYYLTNYKLNTINFEFIYNIEDFIPTKGNSFTEKLIVLKEDNLIYEYLKENKYELENGLYIKKEE